MKTLCSRANHAKRFLLVAALLIALSGRAQAQAQTQVPPPLSATGSELFRGLFDFYQVEPLTIDQFNRADLKDVIVVILGLPGPDDFDNLDSSTARVLEAGGAVLIAADQPASLARYFPNRPRIEVTGEPIFATNKSRFDGRPECPFVTPLDPSAADFGKWLAKNNRTPTPEWMLFFGMNKLATNEPSALRVKTLTSKYTWSRLAGFPANSWVPGIRRQALKPPGQEERVFAVGGAGIGEETYRSLVLADPSVFTNQMLAPDLSRESNQNFEFARRVVQWLRGPNERSVCLFVEAGVPQTRFNEVKYAKYQTPRMPPMPIPPLPSPLDPKLQRGLNDFADRQLAELEDRDIPNRVVSGSETQFRHTLKVLAVVAAVLSLLYFLRRIWSARHEPDLPRVPSDTRSVTGTAPPGSLARRREELLQLGDYTALVREYLRELFSARGLPPQPTPAPRKHPPATVRGPDAGILLRDLRILWNVAQGRDDRVIDYTRWKELEPMIAALQRAADEDRWRFVYPGEMA